MRTMRWVIVTFVAIAAMGFAARATASHTVVTTRTTAASAAARATPVKLAALVTPARAAAPAATAKPAKCTHGSQPHAIGTTSALDAIAVVTPCDVWAVGATKAGSTAQSQTLIEHWNGASWTQVTSPDVAGVSNSLQAITVVRSNDLWAAGYTVNTNNVYESTLIEHWNGRKWAIVASPSPAGQFGASSLAGIWAAGASNIWAVGSAQYGTTSGIIEHWNGKHWTSTTLVNPAGTTNGTYLAAVTGGSRKDVWAGGTYCHTENQCVQSFYHWNGAKWRQVPSPAPPAGADGFIFGLSVSSAKSAWAVGELDSSTIERGLIEHWNGTKWRRVNSGLSASKSTELNAVTASGANVLAVGDQEQSSGLQATLIVTWNGKHWTRSRIRNPFGKSVNYSLAGASGGTCATSWFVGRTFSSPAADQPIAVHC